MSNVFISHKYEDSEAAAEIHNQLKLYSPDAQIFSSTRMRLGRDYREDLIEALKTADWFILIYKNPSLKHDWCLYEAGQFEAINRDKNNRLIEGKHLLCIHPSDVRRPTELDPYQSVPASLEPVREFLKVYFADVGSTILEEQNKEQFDSVVQKVTSAVAGEPVVENLFSAFRLVIQFDAAEDLSNGEIPSDATVAGDQVLFLDLFNLRRTESTWDVIKRARLRENELWIREIENAVIKSVDSVRYPPVQTIATDAENKNRYRPVLLQTDKTPENKYEFQIVFPDEGGWTPDNLLTEELGTLTPSILLSLRWYHEIIEAYGGRIAASQDQYGPKQFKEKMRWSLFNLMKEATARRLTERDHLLRVFDCDEDKSLLGGLYDEWEQSCVPALWSGLGMALEDAVWTDFDETPIDDDTMKNMENKLSRLKEIIHEFLAIASRRFAELVKATY